MAVAAEAGAVAALAAEAGAVEVEEVSVVEGEGESRSTGTKLKAELILAVRTGRSLQATTNCATGRTAMSTVALNRTMSIFRSGTMAVVLTALLPLVACNTSKAPAPSEAGPKTFATPDDAGAALVAATKTNDRTALLAIFGSGSADLIFSGDDAQDKSAGENFIAAYQTMQRWRKQLDGSEVLIVGADNHPFPIPLKKNSAGQWYFDAAAGKDEILARRIGRNELATIDVCAALAGAQSQYYSQIHDGGPKQYALKFISDTGKQNGLYWESPEGQPKSPLGPLVVFATDEGYTAKQGSHAPFHGYNYRMLTKQGSNAPGGAKDYLVDGKMVGGFAFIAYPADYGNSGVMTFIVNQDGVVYEKDLGQETEKLWAAMSAYNPDKTWSPAD